MGPVQGEVSHREHDPREMLLLSGSKLFQDVGYVQASIYRIASAINAPKGTFYNYFRSKEELASRVLDRQFEALRESLSRSAGHSASHQLKKHCTFLSIEPPMVEVAYRCNFWRLLAAESAIAIPVALTQRIARGTDIWITDVSDLISLAQKESGTPVVRKIPAKTGVTAGHLLVRSDRSQEIGPIFETSGGLSSVLYPRRCP